MGRPLAAPCHRGEASGKAPTRQKGLLQRAKACPRVRQRSAYGSAAHLLLRSNVERQACARLGLCGIVRRPGQTPCQAFRRSRRIAPQNRHCRSRAPSMPAASPGTIVTSIVLADNLCTSSLPELRTLQHRRAPCGLDRRSRGKGNLGTRREGSDQCRKPGRQRD